MPASRIETQRQQLACDARFKEECLDFNHWQNFLIDHVVMQHGEHLSTGLTTVNVINWEGFFPEIF